jgi:hypothetical protein
LCFLSKSVKGFSSRRYLDTNCLVRKALVAEFMFSKTPPTAGLTIYEDPRSVYSEPVQPDAHSASSHCLLGSKGKNYLRPEVTTPSEVRHFDRTKLIVFTSGVESQSFGVPCPVE